MALASLRQLTRDFGAIRAVDALNLEILEGEVLGLIGPNGAGKTTTLRLLCGLLEPTSGTVEIGGKDVFADPVEAKKLIGFVPDGAPLYANLSARKHLLLVGRLHEMEEDELGREAARLLEAFELADRADDAVGGFSHGMRQKTALACAILPRPPLLVLDEPLSGLDATTTATIKAVLREWADRGGAVLYTSHLLDVVERVCDRIAVLAHGRLVKAGSLEELRAEARSEGTLDQVFQKLTNAEDPAEAAKRVLGSG